MGAKFDESRTFGVEIEAVGLTPTQAAAALRVAGIEARSEGYNHDVCGYWKLSTDASVHDDELGGREFECISPPLSGQEGLDKVRRVVEVLRNAGARVNSSCGLHVHHNASEFKLRHLRSVLALYWKYESAIDELVPLSRRENNNAYCHSLRRNIRQGWGEDRSIVTTRDLARRFDGDYGRYHKINLSSYLRYGTVEFRQHAGTLNGAKITAWILFTQAIVTRAVEARRSIRVVQGGESNWTFLMGTMGLLPCTGPDSLMEWAFNFLKGRRKALRSREAALRVA